MRPRVTMTEEFDQEELPELGAATIGFYLGALLLGIAAAIALAPTIFRAVPSDLTRIQVVLEALADPDGNPAYVVFGNSVSRDAVDTRIVSTYLEGSPEGYNLGSPGQGLSEGFLFYQDLPESTGTILQFISTATLNARTIFNEQKYNAFYMYGYRPDEGTRDILTAIHGDKVEMFDKGYLQQSFDSRWAVRQLLDTNLRKLLRTDLEIDRATYDLYFPSALAEPLTEDKLVLYLEKTYGTGGTHFAAYLDQIEQLAASIRAARAGDRQIILVLAPLNPRAMDYLDPAYITETREFFAEFQQTHQVPVIDLLDILPADKFSDALHPTAEGAEIISRYIGEILAQAENQER